MPSRRVRRASFLPRPSRTLAWTLYSFFSAMISPHKLSATSHYQFPIVDCRFINRQLAIANRQSAVADGLRLSHQVFALRQTKSEETEVSSWIDLIAFARSGAILSTFIFSSAEASSLSGIVFVTIIFSISDSPSIPTALPENTGCVKHAWI